MNLPDRSLSSLAAEWGDSIESERLLLAPLTALMVEALLGGPIGPGEGFGWETPRSWPGERLLSYLPTYRARLRDDPAHLLWSPRAIVLKRERLVIGDIGFHGAPDAEGSVEFGYLVLPEFRRMGYAFEAARSLVGWALARPEVRRLTAVCHKANTPSIRVLRKCGLTPRGGEGTDLRWSIETESASSGMP